MAATARAEQAKLMASARTGDRAPEGLDQPAGHARAGHLRDLGAAGELGVALGHGLETDQRREVRLVGDVEEDGEDSRRRGLTT